MLKPERLRAAVICLLLALGTAVIYAPTAHFDFVNYDDQDYVIDNFNVNRGLSWQSFKWAFQIGYASNWHPLTWWSHMLDCQFFGLHAGGAHLVNVALHTLSSIILFLALRAMTGRIWRSALVAALFAWHPMHVESVAWISERKDVLSTVFFLLTIWAYWRYASARKAEPRKALLFYAAAIALFVLGLMAKPMLVTLPFVLLLLDAWPLRRIVFDGTTERNATKPGPAATALALVVEKLPFFLLSAGSCVITLVAQSRSGAVRPLTEMSVSDRLINVLVAYERYLGKLFWPLKLAVIYPYDFGLKPEDAIVAATLLIGVTAAGIALWQRRPYWLVGWLWYLGTLVPVIGIVQVGGQSMADRYSYVPSIGLFVMVCWAAFDWVEAHQRFRAAALALALAVVAACLWLTSAQVQSWRNGGALSAHAAKMYPDNYMAHAAYASYLLNIGDLDKSRAECDAALKIVPEYAAAHEYLGDILLLQGKYAEAEAHLGRSVRLDPFKGDAHFRLAQVYLALKEPEKAEVELLAALKFDEGNPATRCNLGQALAMEGKLDEAIAQFRQAIDVVFAYPDAHYELGRALSRQHKNAEAIDQYRIAVRFKPGYPPALNNLAWLLATESDAKLRNGPVAVQLAQQACHLTRGREPQLIGTLAAAYAEAGRYDDAVAAAQQAHDVALSQTNAVIAAKNLELQKLYRSHQPYHEAP